LAGQAHAVHRGRLQFREVRRTGDRLLRRLAGLIADMLVTKNAYTDQFFLARRREPMSVSAEIQWGLLPPLTMTVPRFRWQASWSPPAESPATASTTPSTRRAH
jgi:hypothetical protein